MTGKRFVHCRRAAESLCRTRGVVVERGKVSAFTMPGAAIAGADRIGEQGCLERRAHESLCRVRQVGCTRRRVGQNIALVKTLAAYLLLHLGFDNVECKVFPAMLGLELRKCEAVLESAGNLYVCQSSFVSETAMTRQQRRGSMALLPPLPMPERIQDGNDGRGDACVPC